MTINIPEWLLWVAGLAIGIPAIIALVGMAVIGFIFMKGIGKGGFWR